MVSRTCLALLSVGAPLLLSACGTDTTDRTVSGAGIGAAGGAILGAVTPLGPLGGALLGGATGALTTPSQVDLGKPVWRQGASANPPPPRSGGIATMDPATVRNIQAELQRRGYDVVPADGRLGPRWHAVLVSDGLHGVAPDGLSPFERADAAPIRRRSRCGPGGAQLTCSRSPALTGGAFLCTAFMCRAVAFSWQRFGSLSGHHRSTTVPLGSFWFSEAPVAHTIASQTASGLDRRVPMQVLRL